MKNHLEQFAANCQPFKANSKRFKAILTQVENCFKAIRIHIKCHLTAIQRQVEQSKAIKISQNNLNLILKTV